MLLNAYIFPFVVVIVLNGENDDILMHNKQIFDVLIMLSNRRNGFSERMSTAEL